MPTNPPTAQRTAPQRRRLVPPGLLKREDAAEYCGAGPSTWDRLSAAGLTPSPIKLGGSVFYSRRELSAWCARGCPPRADWAPVWRAILAAETTPTRRPR